MNLLEDLIMIKDEQKVGLVGLNDEFFSLYINKLFVIFLNLELKYFKCSILSVNIKIFLPFSNSFLTFSDKPVSPKELYHSLDSKDSPL